MPGRLPPALVVSPQLLRYLWQPRVDSLDLVASFLTELSSSEVRLFTTEDSRFLILSAVASDLAEIQNLSTLLVTATYQFVTDGLDSLIESRLLNIVDAHDVHPFSFHLAALEHVPFELALSANLAYRFDVPLLLLRAEEAQAASNFREWLPNLEIVSFEELAGSL